MSLRAAWLGPATVFTGAEEGHRWPVAGSGDVRLRFPGARYEKVVADWKSEGYNEEVLANVLYRNAEAYFPGAGA